MPDEPTLGELARRMAQGFSDLKEDFRELGMRLDSKVSMERYQLEQQAALERERLLLERVKALEDAREREAEATRVAEQKLAERRAADRRLLFSALIAPALMLLLTLYLASRGAGSA